MANEGDRPARIPGPFHHRPGAGDKVVRAMDRRLVRAIEHVGLQIDDDDGGGIGGAVL